LKDFLTKNFQQDKFQAWLRKDAIFQDDLNCNFSVWRELSSTHFLGRFPEILALSALTVGLWTRDAWFVCFQSSKRAAGIWLQICSVCWTVKFGVWCEACCRLCCSDCLASVYELSYSQTCPCCWRSHSTARRIFHNAALNLPRLDKRWCDWSSSWLSFADLNLTI